MKMFWVRRDTREKAKPQEKGVENREEEIARTIRIYMSEDSSGQIYIKYLICYFI